MIISLRLRRTRFMAASKYATECFCKRNFIYKLDLPFASNKICKEHISVINALHISCDIMLQLKSCKLHICTANNCNTITSAVIALPILLQRCNIAIRVLHINCRFLRNMRVKDRRYDQLHWLQRIYRLTCTGILIKIQA